MGLKFQLVRINSKSQNCQDKFEEVASSPNFTFLGNVLVDGPRTGAPTQQADQCNVGLASLRRHYDAILFAYGASQDKKLGIPGESTLQGIYPAREFVGWYNGHPDCTDLQAEANLSRANEAVIIGQGNVALDLARILLEDIDVLRKTDITDRALAALAQSQVKRVHVIGRRGPMQVCTKANLQP
jgi:adrenodoxin-NADP+ reductase